MSATVDDRCLQGYARLAGFTYLFSMAVFVASFVIVSGAARGDFAATAKAIAGAESLYRLGLALRVVGGVTLVVLGWTFYVLLKPVNPGLALFALLLRLVQAGLDSGGAAFRYVALANYLGPDGQAGARASAAELMSRADLAAFDIQFVYLALTSLVVFWLLFKSRFIPRPFAGFCVAASGLFGVEAVAHLLLPAHRPLAMETLVYVPMFITEVGAGLWLLIRGADLGAWRGRQGA
jgi:hypothetical protein